MMKPRIALALFAIIIVLASQARAQTSVKKPGGVPPKPVELPKGVTQRPVTFFSEGIACYGALFLPPGFSGEGSLPAVVVAPGWMQTAESVEPMAAL